MSPHTATSGEQQIGEMSILGELSLWNGGIVVFFSPEQLLFNTCKH